MKIVTLNVQVADATKHLATPLVADARVGLRALDSHLGGWKADPHWTQKARNGLSAWTESSLRYQAEPSASQETLPSDAQVVGAVQRVAQASDVVVCAAGGLPAELQKHWRPGMPGGYHMEYGFSCMGYELAGALGVKMADPSRDVIVMLGDGSYLMLNSEIATSVMLGQKLTVVLLNNRGYGCINRLQQAVGGAPFNNLLENCTQVVMPEIDFIQLAQGLGARAEKVSGPAELSAAVQRAKTADRTTVIVIDTDPKAITDDGGTWWDVAVPEVSTREAVREARTTYERLRAGQRIGN